MKPTTNNAFRTVLTITVGFAVIYLATEMRWALLVAICVGLVGVFSTFLSEQIDFVWTKLAWILSFIVPNIILSAIFFLFLFPIALLSRVFGKKDPLHLRNKQSSLFEDSTRTFDQNYFERTF
jgi:hypothetical protein